MRRSCRILRSIGTCRSFCDAISRLKTAELALPSWGRATGGRKRTTPHRLARRGRSVGFESPFVGRRSRAALVSDPKSDRHLSLFLVVLVQLTTTESPPSHRRRHAHPRTQPTPTHPLSRTHPQRARTHGHHAAAVLPRAQFHTRCSRSSRSSSHQQHQAAPAPALKHQAVRHPTARRPAVRRPAACCPTARPFTAGRSIVRRPTALAHNTYHAYAQVL